MRIRTSVLGSVAAVATAAAVTVATPAFAQYAANPPQVSTPAERAKTQQLNEAAQSGTTASPAVLNGQQEAQATPTQYQPQDQDDQGQYEDEDQDQQGQYPQQYDRDRNGPPPNGYAPPPPNGSYNDEDNGAQYNDQDNDEDNGAYNDQDNDEDNGAQSDDSQQRYQDQQEQYQNQRDQYEAQQQHYQDQRGAYQVRRAQYDHDIRRYDIARYEWRDYPHRIYAYRYGDSHGLQRLYLIAEPAQQLAFAPVEGPGGHWIGKVRNVEIGVDGRPRRVEIALNRRVSVWVDPGDLRFDPYDHILFTDLTRNELWSMPGATVESADIYEP